MRKRRRTSAKGSGFGELPKRSVREWAVRGTMALVAIFLGYLSMANTLANVVARLDPAQAHALAPGDGRFTAALAEEKFSSTFSPALNSNEANLSRRALQQDATAVKALTVLGLQAQMRGDKRRSDALFAYSTALSRRELEPQLWAIEQAVDRGDIPEALANYDVALRTSPRARDMLFPVLARAVSEPRIRVHLLDVLSNRPVWGNAFIRFAAAQDSAPRAMAELFRAAGNRGISIPEGELAKVVTRLVAENAMEEGWSFYKTFRPEADRHQSRDPEFELDTEVRTPFDWNIGDALGLSAVFLRTKDSGLLDFSVPSTTRATVVTQVELLAPGSYRLEGRSSGIEQPERSRPYWALTCIGGRELDRIDLPNSDEADGRFSGQFKVPRGCPSQVLSLVARSTDRVGGVAGQIENVQLVRAGHQD